MLAKVIVDRGITDDKDIGIFLNPTRNDFYDPFLMPDMEKTVEMFNIQDFGILKVMKMILL